MDTRSRVLVVEDSPTLRDSYVAVLSRDGEKADGVGDLSGAKKAINLCSYHVAMVDIMLGGERNTSNRDGESVLKAIRELDEGTQCIVLSGQDDKEFIRDSLKEYGVFDYVTKEKAEREGFAFWLGRVKEAIAASSLSSTPTWDEIVRSFAFGQTESEFVSMCLQQLDFKGGYENLSRALLALTRHLVPLLPPKGSKQAIGAEQSGSTIVGRYWSKGQGMPVQVRLAGASDEDSRSRAESDSGEVIYEKKTRGLTIVVTRLTQATREDFVAVSAV